MIGTDDDLIQIDESYFKGRRKYKRVRLRLEDFQKEKSKNNESDKFDEGQAKGPWVFRLYESKNLLRCVVVNDRKASTLIPIICDIV